MQLVNLTGRHIIMADERGNVTRIIEPSGERAYIEGDRRTLYAEGDVLIESVSPRCILHLPEPQEGVVYRLE